MTQLKIGSSAPAFALKDKEGKIHALKDVRSDFVVVYFYPRDNTPGCTIEAKNFTQALDEFEKINTTIIGISGGDEKSKQKFCADHDLKILLLSDPDFQIAKKYGVFGEKVFMGNKSLGIFRTTFVLDKKHSIIRIFEQVKPDIHAQEVLDFIKHRNSTSFGGI